MPTKLVLFLNLVEPIHPIPSSTHFTSILELNQNFTPSTFNLESQSNILLGMIPKEREHALHPQLITLWIELRKNVQSIPRNSHVSCIWNPEVGIVTFECTSHPFQHQHLTLYKFVVGSSQIAWIQLIQGLWTKFDVESTHFSFCENVTFKLHAIQGLLHWMSERYTHVQLSCITPLSPTKRVKHFQLMSHTPSVV